MNLEREDPSEKKWPKRLPELSEEQRRIKDDFMKYWHEVLPNRYGVIERFNHGFPARTVEKFLNSTSKIRTLEIGAGLGEHLDWEKLENQAYHCIELRPEMAAEIRKRFPQVEVSADDCQKKTGFKSGSFDRVIAIHVLEHLPDLPRALDEIQRLLRLGGILQVVIPCEGGLSYQLAREISAKRIFQKRYKQSYDWFIQSEHINFPKEILEELEKRFRILGQSYFPLKVPSVNLNLCIGLNFVPLEV